MKLNRVQRQTINDALVMLGDIQTLEDHPPNGIEATLGRDDWKQVTMFLPMTEHFHFRIPTTAFANQRHGQQFTVRTLWRRTTSLEKKKNRRATRACGLRYIAAGCQLA